MSRKVKVRCVHGDVVGYPLVPVGTLFRGKKHCIKVAVNPHLRHPLILGTDWPAFSQLLGVLCADVSWGTGLGRGEAVAQAGDAVPGPLPSDSEETRVRAEVLPQERDDLPLEQSRDETLKNAHDRVRTIDGQLLQPDQPLSYPYFSIIKDRLYRVTQDAQTKEDTTQLVVPKSCREMLFQAAHCIPMAGHLGEAKTRERLMARFFWPGIHEQVRRWCAACRECQLVNPPAISKAPLRPLPLVEAPFERIGMDLIGPLEHSARGHRFALVLVDYATRYPEAVPLRTISAKSVANALFRIISRVGIPKEILTDQGTAFLNLLKRWQEETSVELAVAVSAEEDLGPEAAIKVNTLALVPGGDHLSPLQLADVAKLQTDFADVFSPLPGRTDLIQHHIETIPGEVARSCPYRLPEHKKKVVQEELKAMLELGVIEESHSDWASPIVLVPKTDGSVRFCVDYRRVNAVSKFDAYPMPRVDEMLDRLGSARFYSTLDLTKGYWQIPLSPLSKEKTAFTTPFGLHQFVTLPFGLFGAPATFQRLMDRILRPHSAYAAAYLDDIIIYSNDWQRHLEHVRAVLRSLGVAGLTANPRKCAIGRVEVRYLGFHLGHGQVRPQIDKTAAIAACPGPKTKKEVRQFLGLAGYYRRFIPNYSELTSPLTDLTK